MTSYDLGFDKLTKVGSYLGAGKALVAWEDWRPFSLIALGLTDFAGVNRLVGHVAGNAALCEVARRIGRAIPAVPDSYLPRIGGDSFLVLVRTDERPARALAERLVQAVGAPYQVDQQAVTLQARTAVLSVFEVRSDLIDSALAALAHSAPS